MPWHRFVLRAAVMAFVTTGAAADPAPMPGMTYDSLKNLPDFSGGWSQILEPTHGGPPPWVRILRPEPAATLRGWMEKVNKGSDPADIDGMKRSYCGPPKFSGFNGGLQDYVEFLFTPGRVTITNELGLIRRISLSERPLPTDSRETNSGTSVGHWEGRTLVVETSALNRDIGFLEPVNKLPIKIGRNVRIVEHISLNGPDVLQIVTRMTAPDLLTAPYVTTLLYARDRKHEFQQLTNCVEHDRAFDSSSGRERFDMTPPPDLPPPPSS